MSSVWHLALQIGVTVVVASISDYAIAIQISHAT